MPQKHTPEPKVMCHDQNFWSFFRIVTQKTSLLYPVRNQTHRNDARRTRLSAAFKDSSADRHKRGTTPRSRDHAESGRLTRAPNETASVKQPKLAGFPITQHHLRHGKGVVTPIGRPDDRRQRMGDGHGERGAMQSSDKSSCVTENTVQPAAARRDSLF